MPLTPEDLQRTYPDPLAAALPPLVVDRLRVVHSAAFRRLQLKTQVFVAPDSDHFRTRLSHTLEVAQFARILATLLGLQPDLAEVVALAHDLGHPPFGHAGERALAECLADHGGFEHNRHTLRIVEELEHPYPAFHGLNLTRVVRECLAKHDTRYDRTGAHPLQDGQPPPAESRVVNLADRVTYALHDLQDGLYAGLIAPQALPSLALWRTSCTGPDLTADPDAWRGHLRPTIDRMRLRLLRDVVRTAAATAVGEDAPLVPLPPVTDDGRSRPVALSPAVETALDEVHDFLETQVYRSALLRAADEQARQLLHAAFDLYARDPRRLPPRFQRRVPELGLERTVTDYVAGMTDRFCVQEVHRLRDA